MTKNLAEWDALGAIANYFMKGPPPRLEYTDLGGFEISTIHAYEGFYETAICDALDVHPVERYETEEAAREGHEKWRKEVEFGRRTFTKLGYGSVTDPVEITLKEA